MEDLAFVRLLAALKKLDFLTFLRMVTLQKEMGDGRGSPQEFLLKVGNLFLLTPPAPFHYQRARDLKQRSRPLPVETF